MEWVPQAIAAVWDGRRFAFDAAGRNGAVALVSHTASAQELTALWEAGAGPCVAVLPEGCRHVELQILVGGMAVETIAVELDELLLPDLVAPGLEGLGTVSCAAEAGALILSGDPTHKAAGAMRGLLLAGPAAAGAAPFSRVRVGPLHDPAGAGRRILIHAEAGTEGVALVAGGADAEPLAAHVFAREGIENRPAHDGVDASGAAPETCRERGFRMLAFGSGEDGSRKLTIADFAAGDEIIVFAPRGHVVAWDKEANGSGSRLFLSLDAEGTWAARAVSAVYRPATSTAMAALGGSGVLAIYEGGATATAKGADFAADLAEAIWRRRRVAPARDPGWLASAPAPVGPLPPLARLTRFAVETAPGLSPVVSGLASAFGVSPGALEEIDSLPLPDRLALVQWFAENSPLAMRALRRRLILPPPAAAPPPARIAALLDWCEDPDLRDRLELMATRIGTASATDREAQRLLRQAAAPLDEGWIDLDSLAAAESVMRARAVGGDPDDGPLHRLLLRLRGDREVLAAAQAASRGLDLGQLSEWRSALGGEAVEAGQPAALTDDLAGRLAELAAVDIVLLHRHFRAAARRIKALATIRTAVAALDVAADNGGLAARMDRDGDMLVGMTRLGSASEAAVRALTRVPTARPALVALTGFIDRHVEAELSDPMVRELRRNLQSYGCLLLAQAIARECAEAMASVPGDGPDTGWRERLRSGVVEMLPAYVRAAADALPDESVLGRSLTDRLPAAP